MAIIKCKMCGGDLEIVAENRVAVCEYCGTQQTVPSADSEKKLTLFGRANRLRMACEFDKAAGVYESIVADFPEEAEAYWGLVLCKYGIEYVDDPATGKKIPTCHRSSFDSVMDDGNLEQALENADVIAQKVYREEAKQFERIRKGILEVSSTEKPYDIFICYKETDEKGDRTMDSVLAQDLYTALTDKGYRVFFSRITLQGKLGEAYEPYIFAALNSAKVMLAVGTCYEYYNAVWVKNEWSRYLKICEVDKSKHLIPCYKDLDPEDMPREFKHLQGADLGKMGAVQDILFNMEKYIPLKKETVKETVVVQQSSKVQALLDRGNMALEDGEWAKADGFFEEVLNNDAKCAEAYVGKTLAQERCKSLDALIETRIAIGSEVEAEIEFIPAEEAHIQEMVTKYALKNYLSRERIFTQYNYHLSYGVATSGCEEKYKEAEAYWNSHKMLTRAESFATGETAEKLRAAKERLFSALRENIQRAKQEDESAKQSLQENYRKFLADADETVVQLRIDAEVCCEADYQYLSEVAKMSNTNIFELKQTAEKLAELDGYKESRNLIDLCNKRIKEIATAEAVEAERQRILSEKEAKARAKKAKVIGTIFAVIAIIGALVAVKVVQNQYKLEQFKSADVGDFVSFGSYEQNNNTDNGKEDIEWLVIEKNGDRMLVISKSALDCKPYNTTPGEVTWETCSLRKWLNNDFINAAFSDEEKAKIPTVTVPADKNRKYDTDPGRATQDKVFLLSITEANKYFSDDIARACEPTNYAAANGAYVHSTTGTCGWWYRSPGSRQDFAAFAQTLGESLEFGAMANEDDYAVRPAMWIDLSA